MNVKDFQALRRNAEALAYLRKRYKDVEIQFFNEKLAKEGPYGDGSAALLGGLEEFPIGNLGFALPINFGNLG